MNAPDLLDLALGRLEGDDLARASTELKDDPALADRAARLGEGLRLLLGDPDDFDPPLGLASRTVAFVSAEVERRSMTLEFAPRRPRIRREDFAVAATIVLASALALAPALLRSREAWGRAACANNLQRVGLRLNQYAALNQQYPFVAVDSEVPHVGTMVCRLSEAGYPIEPRDLTCPCSGSGCEKATRLPLMSAVAEAMKRSHSEGCRMLENDFAFHVGFNRGPEGNPGPLPAYPPYTIPILADRPNFDKATGEILVGNSPNHAGRGQNVLYADGHVSWNDDRWVSPVDHDLYLNSDNRPAYGTSASDAVLMPAVLKVQPR